MNYDDTLTEAEFATFTPNAEVVRYLELTRQRLGLARADMRRLLVELPVMMFQTVEIVVRKPVGR